MSKRLRFLCAVLVMFLLIGLFPVSDNLPYPVGTRKAEATTLTHVSPAWQSHFIFLSATAPLVGSSAAFNVNFSPGRVINATHHISLQPTNHFPESTVTMILNGVVYQALNYGGVMQWREGTSGPLRNDWVTHARDVTNLFASYSGGPQSFTININHHWVDGPHHMGGWPAGSSIAQSLQITYQPTPTVPTISSPVPGTRHLNTVNLSASSSVVGGSTITYFWEHSLNGITWSHIGSTTANLNWSIPGHIPEGTTIHLRTTALANGVASAHSTPITFIRGTDPIEAARLAAEAALIAANNAAARAQTAINQTFFAGQTVGQMAHELRGMSLINNPGHPDHNKTAVQLAREARDAAMLDRIPPVLNINWSNRRTATFANAETLHINANDNQTPVGQLSYRITVNGTLALSGTGIPLTISVPLGAGLGLKKVVVTVTDQGNNTVQGETQIWRLS